MNTEELNKLVKATNLKVGELEKKIGLSQGDLSKIRGGTRVLKPEQETRLRELAGLAIPTEEVVIGRRFIALCNKMGVSIEEMFCKIENPPLPVEMEKQHCAIGKQYPKPRMINI